MKIEINGVDYAAALDAAEPLTIVRRLNQPTSCRLILALPLDGSLAAPQRNQRIRVVGGDGRIYFTGYLAASPLPQYAGMAIEGPRYRTLIEALSDESLLDQLLMPASTGMSGQSAGSVLSALVKRTGITSLTTTGSALASAVGQFAPAKGAIWSQTAGESATEARSAYHALDGQIVVAPMQAVTHALSETAGTLQLASLAFTSSVKRALANDVTVCGEHEPAAYVTEYFVGDGTTKEFDLAANPYSTPSSKVNVIQELFNEAAIDQRYWSVPSASQYFALGSQGLTMNGGSGVDGATVLSWIDRVEMGGSLLLEASGVTLSPGSTGILAGFFTGAVLQASCTAGFLVTAQQGTGAVSVQPLVAGNVAGIAVSINPANQYTLRTRIYAPEVERQHALYRSFGDNGAIAFGGDGVDSSARIQMEVQTIVNGAVGMPVTVYDGVLSSVVGSCTLAAASSTNLLGAMRAIRLTRHGAQWITRTPSGGGTRSCRFGTAAQAGECHLMSSGRLIFLNGDVPAAGERIAVSYRNYARALGRSINTASQQALTLAGSPAEAAWIGTVAHPLTRSSADCRNAAQALQQAAAGVGALWAGRCKATQLDFSTDVWPGDGLYLTAPSANLDANVVVRAVKLTYRNSFPDAVEYAIDFANDWAEDLAIRTSATVPADAELPATADPTLLANLNALVVTALSGVTVSIDAGQDPPTGGGFEIRLRDHAFMPGEDPDLVMRSTVRQMTFSRINATDRFYIRMYDGSTPPNYSEFSAALFINLPLGS